MSSYVITINEKSKSGKELKKKLLQHKELRMTPLDDFESREEEVIAREIEKAKRTRSYTYIEAKAKLARMRRKIES